MFQRNELRRSRWYFGGLSSTLAITVTHPLDLLKVQLQTQQLPKLPARALIAVLYKKQGILGFYNGVSASMFRQMTYTTVRFGLYEEGKMHINIDSVWQKLALAAGAGAIGGVFGVPSDMVNVRMQNDAKLPPDNRRNYKHIVDGLIRVCKEEGPKSLFTGGLPAILRAVMNTFAIPVYDETKSFMMRKEVMSDGFSLHFTSSFVAGFFATAITQPIDVIKTRAMNAKPGEFKGLWDITVYTGQLGPTAFFKGFTPAFLRMAPQTILLFIIMEQLRLYFGILPEKKTGDMKN